MSPVSLLITWLLSAPPPPYLCPYHSCTQPSTEPQCPPARPEYGLSPDSLSQNWFGGFFSPPWFKRLALYMPECIFLQMRVITKNGAKCFLKGVNGFGEAAPGVPISRGPLTSQVRRPVSPGEVCAGSFVIKRDVLSGSCAPAVVSTLRAHSPAVDIVRSMRSRELAKGLSGQRGSLPSACPLQLGC